MSEISTHTNIHRQLKGFVKWIAPDPDTREKISIQGAELIGRVSSRAEADGLIIKKVVYSGSYDKESGLKRFMRGHSVVEGQDVDIAFILQDTDKNGNKLGCLVDKFKEYLKLSYPETKEIGTTKSSATICFVGTKLRYDVVPLFQTSRPNIQLLKRTNGDERTTSVVKHTNFVKDRKDSSDKIDGVVRFNECLRLMKWWKYEQQEHSGVFGNEKGEEKVPSFLLDLLCAAAYDNRSVDKTYATTLAKWFGYLANAVRNRKDVLFGASIVIPNNGAAIWKVIDPIDNNNNIVSAWDNSKINELARWLENGRDEMSRAIRYDEEGDEVACTENLVKLFGNAFKNNNEE
jgi:hypothetical protein